MIASQVGEPRVCLSFNGESEGAPEEDGFVTASFELKIDERADEDGPVIAEVRCPSGKSVEGKTIEKRSSTSWLVFRIPSQLCPEGKALKFQALADGTVLWQGAYEVIWRGRFPTLASA